MGAGLIAAVDKGPLIENDKPILPAKRLMVGSYSGNGFGPVPTTVEGATKMLEQLQVGTLRL